MARRTKEEAQQTRCHIMSTALDLFCSQGLAKTSLTDDNVFSRNEFVWGADGRGNAGLGLWQLAYASKQTLDVQSYADARASHQSLRGDNGKPLAIRSAELWVPPNLEQAALEVVQAERLANGATNVMRGLSKVVVCPWLAA